MRFLITAGTLVMGVITYYQLKKIDYKLGKIQKAVNPKENKNES